MFALTFVWSILAFLSLTPHASLRAQGTGPETGALARAVRKHVAGMTSWKEPEIEIRSVTCLNESDPLPGDSEYRVSSNASVTTLHSLILPVDAMVDGAVLRTFWVKAEISIHATVVQAARRLAFGSVLGIDDIREVETELTDIRADYLKTCDLALGKVLKRPLSQGDPLTRDAVANPLLIRSGEMVRLVFQSGPVSLAALARAEQDGRIGQVIRVRNVDFSRTVKGLVTGRGEVRIE